jgi:hypothetical protein
MMHCDLRDRSVDFIFGRIAMPNTEGDLDVEFLFDDPLVAVVGASSKWLRRRKVDAAELINEPWCLPPFDWYAEAAGSAIPEAFRARGLTVPRHTVKSNSGNLFFSLVAAGPYISALPASIIRLNGKRLGIRGLPFEFPIRPDPVCIATLSTCQKLAIKIVSAEVRAPSDLDAAFRAFANDHVQAVIVLVDGMLFDERNRIAALAAATQLPAIYGFRDHVDAGGLASYGVNLSENFHRAATYVNKLLRSQTRRSPCRVPYQARVSSEQQGRQGARIEYSAVRPCACRRGDRVNHRNL